MQNNLQERIKLKQQVELIENAAKACLDKEALQRYGNLRIDHQEKAFQIATVIVQAVQEGAIRQQITDTEFKAMLQSLQEPKKEFKFSRR